MNFDEAIRSHAAWKLRLGVYLAKPDGSIRAPEIARDDGCDLGRWIHGEGETRYGGLAEFAALKTHHAAFHRAAADVVRRADAHENVAEELALGGESEYAVASNAVVTAIMTMKRRLASPG